MLNNAGKIFSLLALIGVASCSTTEPAPEHSAKVLVVVSRGGMEEIEIVDLPETADAAYPVSYEMQGLEDENAPFLSLDEALELGCGGSEDCDATLKENGFLK